jgi:hypothetical protein
MKTKQSNLMSSRKFVSCNLSISSIQGILTLLWLLNPHGFIVRKILHSKKSLPKHVNTQIQELNQLVIDFGFNKIRVIEYSFILHWTQHLNHGNFYQCHIFWNVVRQDGRIRDDQVHSLIIELMEWRASKATWTLLFMVSLNINFLHI